MVVEGHPGSANQEELTQAIVSEAQNRHIRGIKSLSLDGETMNELFDAFRVPVSNSALESFSNPGYKFQIASSFLTDVKSVHSMRERVRLFGTTLSAPYPSEDDSSEYYPDDFLTGK
jgi:hypothetical protein